MAAKTAISRRARGKVGRKGELFPPKAIRQQAGLKAGDEVIFEARKGAIHVEKVLTLKEAFARKKFAKMTFEEFEKMTSEVLFPPSVKAPSSV